ncbi:Retrotransposon-derived protein PEG10 [Zancudomyces culisetae]|uniref:Retrotransposon-derived protein PEG10 n=1 Tax=Zancudomyces culisetae TaxID=1213189 RepID=A0A1R1PRW6_ZANCU|nr:Retrotransposon-derived protein PEG10 [Zancudomyces culisetae]|eukprot:OMH83725.1 Retrotransposon-derived protein PEG10 [Zancudomyces culisetae]
MVQTLMNQMARLTEEVDTLRQSANVQRGLIPEPKVPSPEKFSGSRKDNVKNFLSTVSTVFKLQPSRFPTDHVKVLFIGTLLTEGAQTWFRTLQESRHPILFQYDNFVAQLDRTFGEPNAVWVAQNKLNNLRQGKSRCLAFTNQFKSIALETDYNEPALLKSYYEGLNDEIKDALSTLESHPPGFEDFAALCIRIDNRIYQRKAEKIKIKPWIPPSHFSNREITRMDVDSMGIKRVSESERDNRMYNRLCFYCGGDKHTVSTCPRKFRNQEAMSSRSSSPIRKFKTSLPNRKKPGIIKLPPFELKDSKNHRTLQKSEGI